MALCSVNHASAMAARRTTCHSPQINDQWARVMLPFVCSMATLEFSIVMGDLATGHCTLGNGYISLAGRLYRFRRDLTLVWMQPLCRLMLSLTPRHAEHLALRLACGLWISKG